MQCFLSSNDSTIKNKIDGTIIHIIELDRASTLDGSLVSLKSHIIANIEVSGKDTTIAPKVEDFLLITETAAIIAAETMVLIIN